MAAEALRPPGPQPDIRRECPWWPEMEPGARRTVARRFNRARYDADLTVAAFASRLKDAVDLDSVREDLAAVVQKALEPVHL